MSYLQNDKVGFGQLGLILNQQTFHVLKLNHTQASHIDWFMGAHLQMGSPLLNKAQVGRNSIIANMATPNYDYVHDQRETLKEFDNA